MVQEIKAYKAKDGKVFALKKEAGEHENRLIIAELVDRHCVYSKLDRDTAVELIDAIIKHGLDEDINV